MGFHKPLTLMNFSMYELVHALGSLWGHGNAPKCLWSSLLVGGMAAAQSKSEL